MTSFYSFRKFRDDKNFPYGFARCGSFSREQARLIETHGLAYLELSSGVRSPCSESEITFVNFCRGKKIAESMHERVWEKYLGLVDQKLLISVFGGPTKIDFSADGSPQSWE